jgi:NAD dependent epimerase/dehydratase family enzyme
MGEFGDVVLKGQRVTPSRLAALGYSFACPVIDEALAAVFRD